MPSAAPSRAQVPSAFSAEVSEFPEARLLDDEGNFSEEVAQERGTFPAGGGGRLLRSVAGGLALVAAGVVIGRHSVALEASSALSTGLRGTGVVQLQAVTSTTAKPPQAAEKGKDGQKSAAGAASSSSTAAPTGHTNASSHALANAPKEKKACKKAHAADEPGLFCWSVMFPGDVALVTSQFTGKAGMFACNDYAVISPEDKLIGKDECGEEVRTWKEDLPAVKKGHYGVDAETSSWLNVPIFLLCWDRVIKSGKVWEQDFTVKLDPDAVFFPDRLAAFLAPHKGKAVFTTDCRFWGGDQVGKLFGAIEVLSKQAMGAYKENSEVCRNLPYQGWGEDMWMQKCMDANKIPAVGMFDQVSDGTCPLGGYASCSENKVVFHPKKDAGEWWECWKQSAQPAAAK